jgi:uncharacterized NAD-dependent epimerase/dehydratase family protein
MPASAEVNGLYYSQSANLVLYAEGEFGKGHSKTAEGVLRYGKNPVVAVIDSTQAGKQVQDVTSIKSNVPIVGSLAESFQFKPQALLLGTAWIGGQLPSKWKPDILSALENGLDVINGLHDFLAEDSEIAQAAMRHNRRLLDVRRPPASLPVASGKAVNVPALTILTVGSDCTCGKMTAALEITRNLEKRGRRSKFQATGQTGIMIEGHGIAIDRVIGDFMAGAAEQLVLEAAFENDFVLIEGQGSLIHPGFSGVTLALLHGSAPKSMILCHRALQNDVEDDPNFPIPKLSNLVEFYETAAAYIRPSKVLGVVLNTSGMTDSQARDAISEASLETGLPATDPVRYGTDNLVEAILAFKETIK